MSKTAFVSGTGTVIRTGKTRYYPPVSSASPNWTSVQNVAATGSGSSATISITPHAAGNILVFGSFSFLSGNTPTVASITSSGNTSAWTAVGPNRASTANANINMFIAAATVTTAAAVTVTVDFSASATNAQLFVWELQPTAGFTFTADGGAVASNHNAGSTSFPMASMTPGAGNTDLFVAIARSGSGNNWTGVSSPFTLLDNSGFAAAAMAIAVNIKTSQAPTFTNATSLGNYDGYAVLLSQVA